MEISPIASTVVAQGQKERVKNAVLQLVVRPWARFILTTATTEASGAQPLRHVSFGGREGMRGVLEQAVLEGRQAPMLLDGGDKGFLMHDGRDDYEQQFSRALDAALAS